MHKGIEDFLSKVSQEKFWKYLELKVCLLRDSIDEIWKVAFIQIQLLKESKVFDEKLPRSKNLLLIHKLLSIESLRELVEQISKGKQIKIGIIIASLEWIQSEPRYDFKTRAYVKQTFHIDEACHIVFKSGEYTDEIDRIVRQLEPLVGTKKRIYRDLDDALNSLFGIEFGKPAYFPFVRIFAPVYVKIEESKTEIINNGVRRLEVKLSTALETNLSKMRLLIFGENENAKPTKLAEQITTFKRKDSSELMNLIVIDVDEETRYTKLNLDYGGDLLEDYYLTIPKQVVRGIIDTIEVTDSAEVCKIGKIKQEIMAKYILARNENNDTDTKGKALEDVISKILELVPGLKVVDNRVVNEIQEIDLIVRNHNRTNVWADFESVFFVECKNWFKDRRPGASTIRDFKGKMENKNLKTGIFVAPNGIAEGRGDDQVYGTNGQIDKYFHGGTKIIVLEHDDLMAILNCKDVTERINDKFMEFYRI